MKIRSIDVITFLFGAILLTGCIKEFDSGPGNQQANSYDLDFSNVTTKAIRIKLTDEAGTPHKGVKITLWDKSPLDNGVIILKGFTDQTGNFETEYSMPNTFTEVVMELSYLGLPDFLVIPVEDFNSRIEIAGFNHDFDYLADELVPAQSVEDGVMVDNSGGRMAANTILEALGTFNSQGKPSYLLTKDVITAQLLEFINASLPEREPVPDYHPAYLAEGTETNLNIEQEADVWMTFVTEGAGYRNTLGFYTYPTGSAPASATDIKVLHIGFPNASLSGSGGQLNPGDKIRLGKFQPGTSIGFVLIADGFNSATSQIKDYATRYYSHNHLNPESVAEHRQHTVTLYDEENKLFLIGFEDLNRDNGSDNDFNDAVFYITSNPITAISKANINPIDKPGDNDGDGVSNVYDEFPDDPAFAYKYDYPSSEAYGTFSFEDRWPGYGDYDFNDFVVDYRFTQFADANNKITNLKSEFVIKAIGASYQNGFGFSTKLAPSLVATVTGSELHGSVVTLNANGTEQSQSKATIIVSDNVHSGFPTRGIINTIQANSFVAPDTIRNLVSFTRPVTFAELGSAPYNPFLFINQERGREVHMPGYEPTDLADHSYFGTENDNSDPSRGIYYRSKEELPWAMNLPMSFDYPVEGGDVREGYLNLNQWAKSSGFSYMDWYMDKPGYRNTNKLYKKK
ncbi:LruC domain-containing protein [uncultured Imperialibacter sp.]|uniref:LruC domain-containing protein n=1 Tax=uncultured Imperialibacter sp. TaxID=1672639 RepID=UPI0030DA318F|tara:strand:+ start:11170 stop:13218 length:2049 start_codon:yes stop_codon:yes gene_type:complete